MKLEDCMNMCTRCFAIKEDEYLPPSSVRYSPEDAAFRCGPGNRGVMQHPTGRIPPRPDEYAHLSSIHSPQPQTIKHSQKRARPLRAFSHSLIQVVSKIIAVMGYKGKRCAAHSGSYKQPITTTTFILDFPL